MNERFIKPDELLECQEEFEKKHKDMIERLGAQKSEKLFLYLASLAGKWNRNRKNKTLVNDGGVFCVHAEFECIPCVVNHGICHYGGTMGIISTILESENKYIYVYQLNRKEYRIIVNAIISEIQKLLSN